MSGTKQSQGRTMHPDRNWQSKMQAARENDAAHASSDTLVQLLWSQGFGPVAAARMLDWYGSCHPENLKGRPGQKETE